MMPDKRRDHIFGTFSVPVSAKWLATILAVGLINFGVVINQFDVMKTKIEEVKTIAMSANAAAADARTKASADAQILFIKDAHQDGEIARLGAAVAELKGQMRR